MATKSESSATESQSSTNAASDTSSTQSAASSATTSSSSGAASSGASSSAQGSKSRELKQRKGQFLIAPRRTPQMQMMGISQSLRRLYVKPRMDYWSYCQEQPDVSNSEVNVIGLRALSEWPALANFPQQQQLTWGQKAMRLDQLPAHYRGQGIRIAIVDSGTATSHQDLVKITRGVDIINKTQDASSWSVDTISHGSHCAGVIAGKDSSWGIRGFAPEAEVHTCKLFPGGQISQLIEALEYCIEKQIDVVNLSLGGAEPSEALEQQIIRAKQAGVACIVAAGNS